MKSTDIRERMANRSLADLDAVWKELSASLKVGSGAFAFRHDRQHACRAAKWLPVSLGSENPTQTSLSFIARLDPQENGAKARTAFLQAVHGVPADATTLPNNIRKAANNVAESVRRAIKFFRALIPEEELPEAYLWPPPPKLPGLERGVRLYRDIRKAHLREGVLDPENHVPAITQRVAHEHAERGRRAGSYGSYNLMIRNLRRLLADCNVPGVPASLSDGLSELRLRPDVGPRRIIPIADLAKRWPQHFRMTPAGDIDLEFGVLGFFNRDIGLRRPSSPSGAACPSENLLGPRALHARLGCLRRFLVRVATPEDVDLAECFRHDRVWDWLTAYIEERGEVSSMHLQAWWAVRYTARAYFGIDTSALDRLVEEGIEFPDSGTSMKGTNTLQKVGDDPVAELHAQAAALRHAAEASHKPGEGRRTGLYFPRKSAEIDFWLRLLTGLRPSNVDSLEVLDRPAPETTVPAIWRDGSAFVVCIPFRSMKQNKRRSKGRPLVSRAARVERPYIFRIEYAPAVAALDEYLSEGWCFATAVHAGQTRRLLLNAKGEAFRSFETSQRKTRKRAVDLHAETSGPRADLDRYATRHIMAELLRRYMPGGRLTTLYLTHRSEKNADTHYGSDDGVFLRQCIHEILDGKPPLPEQQRQHADQLKRQESERHRIVENMAGQLMETNSELKKLTAALAAKEEELRALRGRLAEEKHPLQNPRKAA